MASTPPDSHPDSPPTGPSEDVERVSPPGTDGRESVEDATHDGSPLDPPGIEDGVAGTGGVNKTQDRGS